MHISTTLSMAVVLALLHPRTAHAAPTPGGPAPRPLDRVANITFAAPRPFRETYFRPASWFTDLPQQVLNSAAVSPSQYNLEFKGGVLLNTLNVYIIWYGNFAGYETKMQNFQQWMYGLVSTRWWDILTPYVTSGHLAIGRSVVVTPPSGQTSFTDADLQKLVSAFINAGVFPLDERALYYVQAAPEFKAGTIDSSGSTNCNDWCGYHGAYNLNNIEIKYGITSMACDDCYASDIFQYSKIVFSHELAETMTDGSQNLAWYKDAIDSSQFNGEIGDYCSGDTATSYSEQLRARIPVQGLWSNDVSACISDGVTKKAD